MTDHRKEVQRRYRETREARGDRRVTVWLSTAARTALDQLGTLHGSKDAAIEHLLTTTRTT